jgi:hypothetical protein
MIKTNGIINNKFDTLLSSQETNTQANHHKATDKVSAAVLSGRRPDPLSRFPIWRLGKH